MGTAIPFVESLVKQINHLKLDGLLSQDTYNCTSNIL